MSTTVSITVAKVSENTGRDTGTRDSNATVAKPPLGRRPRWVGIEHWMAGHPRLAWLAAPLHAVELWRWRRSTRRWCARTFGAPDGAA